MPIESVRPVLWSFVTVTYNNAATIQDHWTAERPADCEWIVVDNASRDDSVPTAKRLGADHVISLKSNIGFGAANNVGMRVASGRYIVFVNPDVAVDYSSLPRMQEHLDGHDCIVGPQLVYPDGSLQPSGRGKPSLKNKVLSRLKHAPTMEAYYHTAEPGEVKSVSWIIGAAVAARSEVFERLGNDGPWDTAFFVYYEDADICLRAWQQGIPVRVVGDVRWVHSWARATGKFSIRPWLLEFRSLATFAHRYPAITLWNGTGLRLRRAAQSWGL